MEKISEDMMLKTAHLVGVTKSLARHGYTADGIKLAYVQSGLFPAEVADFFVKEALEIDMTKEGVAPLLAGVAAIGSRVAPWLLRGAKSIGQAAGKMKGSLMQQGAQMGGLKGKATQLAGQAVGGLGAGAGKAAKGLGKATYQMTANARQAGQAWQGAKGIGAKAGVLGSGVKNFGAGAVLGGGKGLGGKLGRGAMYGSLATGVAGMGGGGGQVPQYPRQQMMMYPQQ